MRARLGTAKACRPSKLRSRSNRRRLVDSIHCCASYLDTLTSQMNAQVNEIRGPNRSLHFVFGIGHGIREAITQRVHNIYKAEFRR